MIAEGMRVRIGVRDSIPQSAFPSFSQPLTGTVVSFTYDTLYLRLGEAPTTIAIPRRNIVTVAMSAGPPSRRISAAYVGGMSAVILGLFMPEIDAKEQRFGSEWAAAAVGATIGFAAGALVGALIPSERWRTAWIPE